jgi:hypothetical protein
MTDWRKQYRKCEKCRSEYRPKRQAQSYCSRECKRAAAYGRERFKAGTQGKRRRRLEASDKPLATPLSGKRPKQRFFFNRNSSLQTDYWGLALRWFGPRGSSMSGQHPALSKAMMFSSTTTQTAFPSCRRVSTVASLF